MYSGTLDSQRFSRLDQVNAGNVDDLELKWAYQIPQIDRAETVPLVVDGIMFVTEAPSNVVALDAATGRQYWRYNHELPDDLRICCGRNNRGVAILGETLYMSTLDAQLAAIDARTGNLRWATQVAPYQSGYSKTAAPLIVKDRVVTGIAGGEYGIRGFVDAYNPETGALDWRTDTIPDLITQTSKPGRESRGARAGRPAGSPGPMTQISTSCTGAPAIPGPTGTADVRLGDNLYSDSVLALDGTSGNMDWYFQFTPHDVHDWDAIQVPILADIEYEGRTRKVMMWANRNAFYYTLDRETGEFLVGKPYALQTWAEGLDETGRPSDSRTPSLPKRASSCRRGLAGEPTGGHPPTAHRPVCSMSTPSTASSGTTSGMKTTWRASPSWVAVARTYDPTRPITAPSARSTPLPEIGDGSSRQSPGRRLESRRQPAIWSSAALWKATSSR